MNEPTPAPIVVGVDGSEDSAQALRWAATEAALRGCAVEAISVSTAGERVLEARTGYAPFADRAAAQVAAVARAHPTVQLRHIRTIGSPAPALVRTARGAAMLVVGSRGAGAMARALLGSVSSYCARHADCPVVIISKPKPVPAPKRSTVDSVATLGPLL
jgi:nucleotide-binding universal stress UspA family protein